MTPPYRGSGSVGLERQRQFTAWRAVTMAVAVLGVFALGDLLVAGAEYAYILNRHVGPPASMRVSLIAAANLLSLAVAILAIGQTLTRASRGAWIALAGVVCASVGAVALSTELTRWAVTSLSTTALMEWVKDFELVLHVAVLARPVTLAVLVAYCALRLRRLGPPAPVVCPHCAAQIDD